MLGPHSSTCQLADSKVVGNPLSLSDAPWGADGRIINWERKGSKSRGSGAEQEGQGSEGKARGEPVAECTRRSTFTRAWERGGEISAIPSGPEKIRAYHPTWYLMDEAAYLPDGEECLAAVRPSGARIIAISSARAGWFADQISL